MTVINSWTRQIINVSQKSKRKNFPTDSSTWSQFHFQVQNGFETVSENDQKISFSWKYFSKNELKIMREKYFPSRHFRMRGFLCPSDSIGHMNEADAFVGHFLHFWQVWSSECDHGWMCPTLCVKPSIVRVKRLDKYLHHSFPVNWISKNEVP